MDKNGIFSTGENTDYSASTKKRLSGENILLFICAGIAAFCDFVLMIVAAVIDYGASVVVFPVFMLIADCLFIAGIRFTNFRFKYSLWVWVGYVVFSLFMTVLMLSLNGGMQNYDIMTTTACALDILAHILLWIVIGMCALFGYVKKDKKNKIILCAVVGIAVFMTFTYSVFVASNGYFGQGESLEIRAVAYKYDKQNDGYIASELAGGNGTKVVIPATFNGKKVFAVDTKIFASSIDNIVLESREKVEFIGLDNTSDKKDSISLGVDRDLIDDYRSQLINTNSSFAVSMANYMYPTRLADDEVYISFAYDWYDSSYVRQQLIPTYIGKKGEVFDIDEHAGNITYIDHGNNLDNADMHWAFTHNNGYIYKNTVAEEKSVNNTQINSNVFRAEVQFERVYRVSIGEDNDTKYEPKDTFKQTVIDGNTYDYRYVSQSNANSLLTEISRDGFYLNWYDNNNSKISDFSQYLTNNCTQLNKIAYINPEWTLKSPVIEELFTDRPDSKFIYGDGINFTVKAKAPVYGYNLDYSWMSPDSVNIGNDYQTSLSRVKPDMSGNYSIKITASSDETSLTSEVVQYINVTIDKKTLALNWSFPQNAIYDGQPKKASYTYNPEDAIAGDLITFTDDIQSVVNAGTYTNTVKLTDGYEDLYRLDSSQKYTYTVSKRPVTLVWEEKSFVYNGTLQYPQITGVNNAVSGEENFVLQNTEYNIVGGINAGNHTVKAVLSAGNYCLDGEQSKSYAIDKKQIAFVWQDTSEFVYNGQYQYPKVSDLTDVLQKDKTFVLDNIVYKDTGKNAGEYKVSASLGSAVINYSLTGTLQKSYTISRKDLTVNAKAQNKTYDGKQGGSFSITADGLASSDSITDLGNPLFSGDAVSAKDAGTYTLYVSLAPNQTTANYNITYNSATFEIYKKKVNLVWSNASFEWDGNTHSPKIVEAGQPYEGQTEVSYKYYDSKGTPLGSAPKDAGTYTVEAVVQSKNFDFGNTKISFTITKEVQ